MKVIINAVQDNLLIAKLNFSCGCDYCECSCDSDTLLPEDSD